MVSFNKSVLVVGVVVSAVCGSAMGASPVVATFDSDAQGFVASTTSTTQIHLNSGGNPGGHIELRRDLSPPAFNIGTQNSTTPAFLGDYAAGGITGAGFDLNVFNTALTGAWVRVRTDISSNGWYYNFGAINPDANAWHSYLVNFNPTWSDATAIGNGWVQEDASAGSFASAFSNVGWFEVRIINPDNTSAIVGLDNIRLVPAPGAGVLALAGMGLLARRRR